MKIASESGFIPDTFPNVTTINAFANEGISPTEVGWWSNTEELQLNLLDARRLGTLLSSKVLDRIPAIYEGSLATSQVPFSQLEFGTRLKDVAEKCAIWIGEGPVLIKVRFGCRYVEMLRL